MNHNNTILYFWNASCLVCEPLYEKLVLLVEAEFPRLDIEKINSATNPDLRSKFQVFSSPLIILIMDEKEFFRSSGNVSLRELREKILRLYKLKYN